MDATPAKVFCGKLRLGASPTQRAIWEAHGERQIFHMRIVGFSVGEVVNYLADNIAFQIYPPPKSESLKFLIASMEIRGRAGRNRQRSLFWEV